MQQLALYEHFRALEQQRCDAARTARERNRTGQFATPARIAAFMVELALRQLGREPIRFLEPGLGTGAFYSQLLQRVPASRIAASAGVENCEGMLAHARVLWGDNRLEVIRGDFTTLKPPPQGYNLILCNPPYVRHHHLEPAAKANLQARVHALHDLHTSQRMGMYGYFLLLADAWLSPGGLAGWLIPSEFASVNYGTALKAYLTERVQLVRMHHFDASSRQFSDALVSSSLVFFRKQAPRPRARIEITVGSLQAPHTQNFVRLGNLPAHRKWSPAGRPPAKETPHTTVGDLFTIRRGIATGGNAFFVRSAAQIAGARLPMHCFRPILPSCRHLPTDEIEADDEGNPRLERARFLLNCALPEAELAKQEPALWAYLQNGRDTVAQGYLCRRRTPWYSQEKRDPPPFLCTYMGRGKLRFLWNHSRAIAANTYLLLYPKPVTLTWLNADPTRGRHLWEALRAVQAEDLVAAGRTYGGGLTKLEPRELAQVRLQITLPSALTGF